MTGMTLVWQDEWGRRPTTKHVRAVLARKLSGGGHDSPYDGLCAMEMLALLTGQRHTDRPKLVSPVFGNFVRRLNVGPEDPTPESTPHAKAACGAPGQPEDTD